MAVRPGSAGARGCSAAYVLVLEMTANHRSNQTTNPPMYDTLCKPLDVSFRPHRRRAAMRDAGR